MICLDDSDVRYSSCKICKCKIPTSQEWCIEHEPFNQLLLKYRKKDDITRSN